jgi:hypothetical protein
MTYLDHYDNAGLPGHRPNEVTLSWADFTRRRLRWLYGEDYLIERRAMTQADIAAWNAIGSRRAA